MLKSNPSPPAPPSQQKQKFALALKLCSVSRQMRSLSRWGKVRSQVPSGMGQQRHLMLLLLVGTATLTISAATSISYFVVRGLILDNAKQVASLKVHQGTDKIDRWLGTRKAEVESLSYTRNVRTMDWNQVKPRFEQEMERLGKDFANLVLMQADGEFKTLTGQGNAADRPFFREAIAGKLNVSDPIIGRASNLPLVVIGAPIWSVPPATKRTIGVLGATIQTDTVAAVVSQLQYGKGSYAFALNSQGVPIIHPDSNLVGNADRPAPSLLKSTDRSLSAIAREMVNRQSGLKLTQIDGRWVYVAYNPLIEANWSVALVIPRQNIEAQLIALNLLAAVIGSLIGVTGIAALWLLYSSERDRAKAQREAMLNRIAERIRASLDLDQILQATVAEVATLLKLERVAFGWYDSPEQILEILWEYSQPGNSPQIGRYDGSQLKDLEMKLQQRQSLVIPWDRAYLEVGQPLELKAEHYVAMLVPTQNEPQGYLICQHATRWFWTQGEIKLLKAVANNLAIAITQSHLYAQTQEQVKLKDRALDELKRTQLHLVQSEKMSSLGQMVAGVAHEINNPVNFIYGNLPLTREYVEDLLKLVSLYKQHLPNLPPDISQFEADIELEFIEQDLPQMVNSMKMGAERIRNIVLSLRNFSRLDEVDQKAVDLHEGIDNTLLLLSNRLKNQISVVKQYGNLPEVECFPAQLNQVFMNLLSNAVDALLEVEQAEKTITITTELIAKAESKFVRVAIADNGPGIPADIQSQIFNPFFTTKPIGKGTGLGLAISYQIVVDAHQGTIAIATPKTGGTVFILEIPVRNETAAPKPISTVKVPV